jgi:hypothetical protein
MLWFACNLIEIQSKSTVSMISDNMLGFYVNIMMYSMKPECLNETIEVLT